MAESAHQLDSAPGNQPSSPEFGPEELKEIEESSVGQPASPLSSSTTAGKVSFSSGESGSYSPGISSSSTSPGNIAHSSSGDLPAAERSLYNSSSTQPGKTRFGNFLGTRRRKAGAGIGTIVVVLAALFGVSIIQGPAQLAQLSQILQRPFEKHQSDSSNRLGRLYRFAKSGNIGETNVGYFGSKIFGSTIDQLKAIGVEIKTNPLTGSPTETTFDINKLKSQFPELEGMNDSEIKSFLSNRLNGAVAPDQISGSGTSFSIDQTNLDLKTARFLTKSTVPLLDDGKIATAIKSRVMTKYYGQPSLFHPFQRAKAILDQKIANLVLRRQAEQTDEQNRTKAITDPIEAEANGAVDEVNNNKNLYTSGVAAYLFALGSACMVYQSADAIIVINHDRIVAPATLRAVDAIAVGDQGRSGNDLDASQAGTFADNLVGKDGKTVFQGQALKALATNGSLDQSLADLPKTYKDAFSANTTVDSIRSGANTVIQKVTGGLFPTSGTFGVCGPVGLAIQAGVSLSLIFASAYSEAATAGADTPGAIAILTAYFSAGQIAKVAVGAVALSIINNFIVNGNTAKLAADAFSGPVGGDLLAYGARAASNTVSIASGGVALANSTTSTFISSADQRQFDSESIAKRLFDVNDYRSAVSRVTDGINPNPIQSLSKVGNLFTNFGSMFTHTLGSVFPKAAADTPYNWGFPQYGLPDNLLDDPNLADPYANANYVAANLLPNDTNGYKERAMACFGVDITQVTDSDGVQRWDVIPSQVVDTESESYTSNNCSDTDENWHRIIMFVFDSSAMKATACYEGDDPSCNDFTQTNTSTTATSGAANNSGSATSGSSSNSSSNGSCGYVGGSYRYTSGPLKGQLCPL